MNNLCITLAASLVLLSGSVVAESSGAYIGIGFGNTSYHDDNSFDGLDLDDRDRGSKIYGGYRFNDHFAVEGTLANMGEFSAQNPHGGRTKLRFDTFTVSAVGLIPLAEGQLDLFGHAGLGSIGLEQDHPDWDDSGGTFVLGFGLGYNPIEQLTLRVGVDSYAFRMVNYYWDQNMVLNKERFDQSVGMFYVSGQYNFR